MPTTIQLPEVLRGCTPGVVQTVGIMQVIPLLSESNDDRFVSPMNRARTKTTGYGSLGFNNPSDKTMLIPSHVAYCVKQSAQDHAMTHAALLGAKKSHVYNDAKCVQERQGGYINEDEHKMQILPFPLREKALTFRGSSDCGSLWPALAEFNRSMNCYGNSNNGAAIRDYFDHYEKELDEFVAEFEPVPNQVGAIILVNGSVVGIERCPSNAYYLEIWEPLIRDCYAALSIIEERRKSGALPFPSTREPLRDVTSLEDLAVALEETEAKQEEKTKDIVRAILDVSFDKQTRDEKIGSFEVDTLEKGDFVGQCIRDGSAVLYASLIATDKWKKNAKWLQKAKFSI